MDSGRHVMDQKIHRSFLGLNNFLLLASSAILTGILGHFIHHYQARGTHIIYEMVIAVISLLTFLIAMFLPAVKAYRGYLLPLNSILSYLWLTSLIFSSQDYSGRRCSFGPPYLGHCRLKHTVQAFWILGFVTLLSNTIIEALMWVGHAIAGHRNNEKMVVPAGDVGGPLNSHTNGGGVTV